MLPGKEMLLVIPANYNRAAAYVIQFVHFCQMRFLSKVRSQDNVMQTIGFSDNGRFREVDTVQCCIIKWNMKQRPYLHMK